GIAAVLVLCKTKLPAFNVPELLFTGKLRAQDWEFGGWLPAWWPVISFPWWILMGCCVCFSVALMFSTPAEQVQKAKERPRNLEDQVV
ncbi:MAG TPA: hypothetical protein VE154_03255, partial [Chthoniobacterales bacterium]|nr:hypothetical protein [Chthoniobacterales bacterium]